MAKHIYTRCWLHLVWPTLDEEEVLDQSARNKLSKYLHTYSREKGIYMKSNYVHTNHVHALVDMPPTLSVSNLFQLLKGGSSHWINEYKMIPEKFAWGKDYAAFSVSHSKLSGVIEYFSNQEEYHQTVSFAEEMRILVQKHGLIYRGNS